MSEVINKAEHEFWRPPLVAESSAPSSIAVTCRCGTEFMLGSGFCHVCGSPRQLQSSPSQNHWLQVLQFLHVLQFQNIKSKLGLPTASLIAFLCGVACLFGALLTGLIFSAQNFADFQAVQLWRMQWLLGAVAAFVAGILLKKNKPEKQ
jgi:hypothetical protein